jgi:hypothetical protein
MPSPDSILLVTAPVDGSYQDQLDDLNAVLHGATVTKTPAGHKTYSNADAGTKLGKAQGFKFPEFKVRFNALNHSLFIFRGEIFELSSE